MVRRGWSSCGKTRRREALLDTSRMGRGRTENQRKTGKDGLEELETEVARKSIQKRFQRMSERKHLGVQTQLHSLVLPESVQRGSWDL